MICKKAGFHIQVKSGPYSEGIQTEIGITRRHISAGLV